MKTLVYINPDCFFDTDLSVLKYLVAHFHVVWYPVYYTDRSIYYTPEKLKDYSAMYGIELHLCPRRYRQRDPRNLLFYGDIVDNINSHSPDLVFTCITEEIWWTIASARLDRKMCILGVHDVIKHSYGNVLKRKIQGMIQNHTIGTYANVCTFSENQRLLFVKTYGRQAVNLGMSCKDFGPSEVSPEPFADGVKLLFFGSIVKYKGLGTVIGVIEKLYARGIRRFSLTVAGKGDDWELCKSEIRTPELYDLRIRFIDNSEIPGLMCSHHFLVLPYTDATQSGPLLIAMNYGLPVIAPDFGCFRDLYDSSSAVLYNDLEYALRQVAEMSTEEYSRLKNNAVLLKEKNSEEVIANNYISYFDSL